MRKLITVQIIAMLIAGYALPSNRPHNSLVVCSPYADQQPEVIATIQAETAVREFRSLCEAATVVAKPYPSLAPVTRFEIRKADGTTDVYDLCRYADGPSVLAWHKRKMIAISAEGFRAWCTQYGEPYDGNMENPNKMPGHIP